MNILEAILLALSLCVDSLVVSATTAFHSKISLRRGFAMALVFGLCQGGFPLLGALIGDVSRVFIEAVDHWVAFGLLLFVGGKMLVDALKHSDNPTITQSNHKTITLGTMFLLGTATSIDAFAVGIGLGLEHPMVTVLWVVTTIGACTVATSLVGAYLGRRHIPVPERTATLIAGIVLIALGTKILLEHLVFS